MSASYEKNPTKKEYTQHSISSTSPFSPNNLLLGFLSLDLALVLVGVAAFLNSEKVLAPFGSLHVGVGVGWCGHLLGL